MYKLETIMAIISDVTVYGWSIVQYFTEKGIEQGIERGGREHAVEDLLDVPAIRIGLAASEPLAVRIGTTDDVQRLGRCFGRPPNRCPASKPVGHLLDAAEQGHYAT